MTTTSEPLRGHQVDFSFSDEQVLLRDTIRKYLAAEYDSVARKRIVTSSEGYPARPGSNSPSWAFSRHRSPRNMAVSAVVPSKQ
jgi:hypothetical protein